jgi:Leucine-rich repeat (LRR) protein
METVKMGNQKTYAVFQKHLSPKLVHDFIVERGLAGLSVHDVMDPIVDLSEVLRGFSFLNQLHIHTVMDHDWTFLSTFKKLKFLSIQTAGKSPIDLTGLSELVELSLKWRPQILGLETLCQLQHLAIVEYQDKDLLPIKSLKSLKRLTIKTSKFQSLAGIEFLPHLEYLDLGNCKQLQSIIHLNGLQKLNRIHLDSCPKITDYNSLTDLPSLDCLIIMDSKEIASIQFMQNFPRLKYLALTGTTTIVDGDLSPLDNIPEVAFAPKKHYNRQNMRK